MSTTDKMIERLRQCPSDYTFGEAKTLVSRFGYALMQKGNTSGSRVLFYRERDRKKILLHKPHPDDVMKGYAVRQLLNRLIENGDI